MFLFFNITYFFYPSHVMNEEQIFMTRNLQTKIICQGLPQDIRIVHGPY